MTPEKVIAVVEMYEQRLRTHGVPKERISVTRTFASLTPEEALKHAHFLCEGTKQFACDPEKWDKANRHFAALQHCLSLGEWYTLEDLMNHNRPDTPAPSSS